MAVRDVKVDAVNVRFQSGKPAYGLPILGPTDPTPGYPANRYTSMKCEPIIREAFRALLRQDFEGEIDRTPLAELGIDSLDFFEALIALEERHGLVIPIEKLDGSVTLEAIYRALDP